MKKISLQIATALLGLAALQTSLAQGSGGAAPADHSGHAGHASAKPAAAEAAWVEAEVRRVDLASKKITLKHGEIKNIEMPPMTMVFLLKDGAVSADTLAALKVGDKVRFQAAIENGRTLVTALQR